MQKITSPFSELESREWLNKLSALHQKSFGSEVITKSSIEPYMLLRKSLGMTAGYNRNEAHHSHAFTSSCPGSRSIAGHLVTDGWYLISSNILNNIPQASFDQINSMLSQPLEKGKRSLEVSVHFASLLKYILTSEVYNAIKLYLGVGKPIFYPPQILRSKPSLKGQALSDKELSDRAFSFHRDYDNIRWLKLFVNLTSTIGGNHEYIQGSHHTAERLIGSGFLDRTHQLKLEDRFFARTKYESHLWTGRFHQKSINEVYGESQRIILDTQQGVCWLEDTYGLHRGNPPQEGQRAVVAYLIGQYPIRLSDS